MAEPDTTPTGAAPEVLYAENGASWYWLLSGPAAALAMILIQVSSGVGVQWVVPAAFLVLVSGFVALQVKAARIHTSVELTAETLRQGTEKTPVADIVKIYPPAPEGIRSYYDNRVLKRSNALADRAMKKAGLDAQADTGESDGQAGAPAAPADVPTDTGGAPKWQSARALGELTGVPRGRTGIGLRLSGGRTAQAWARRDRALREALTPLVGQGSGPQNSTRDDTPDDTA
ncbi:DUF3093 domain-containing protein [Mycolicibacterium palauense]|uniref:DUF3093 domain-containing protein n=1 Tax=Mycolicibacterium palauense TaxID=2034511 RepID=UPI002E2044B7